ncbi:MAG: phage holin family protein [Patescibacteria group bacterium]|nr:phage holin family protein [Patescibacteria group bacterium]MDD5715329.1 phage holin family protein [Patescibacteria group bacterium]
MKIIIRLALNAGALLVVAYLVPGFLVDNFWPAAIVTALILGIANAVLKPILVILTLPVTIVTLGLSTLVINAGFLWLTAEFVPGFSIDSFWPTAIIGAVILWVISWFTNAITRK